MEVFIKNKLSLILTPISYGFYPAITSLFFSNSSLNKINPIFLGFILVSCKELFTWLFLLIYLKPKKVFNDFKLIKTKTGFITSLAGVLGGPIGYIILTIGSFYIGSALSALLMCLTTPLCVLFENIILKRKISKILILSTILSFGGAFLLVFLTQSNFNNNHNLIIGIILILIVVILWTSETIVVDLFLNTKKTITPQKTIILKLTSSTFSLIFLLLPFVSLIFKHNIFSGYEIILKDFISTNLVYAISLVGFSMLIARLSYLYCIEKFNSTTTTIIYNLSTVMTPIFILLIKNIFNIINKNDLTLIFSPYYWICLSLMLSGAILATLAKIKN